MSTKENLPALHLVDIQKGFYDEAYWGGTRNNPMQKKMPKNYQINGRQMVGHYLTDSERSIPMLFVMDEKLELVGNGVLNFKIHN